MKFVLKACALMILTATSLSLTSCASNPGGSDNDGPIKITKVNPYHLRYGERIETEDQMIKFEMRHHIHGAIESEELIEKFGQHFSIFWKNKNKTPATVRMEYTQAKTGPTLHVQEEVVANPRRSNTTRFEVTGQDYLTNGAATTWRVLILVDGAVVEEYKSFLWRQN